MSYFLYLFNLIVIYSVLAVSLNLLAGYTGLLSLSHAAFFGIGAYTTGIVAVSTGLVFPFDFAIAMAISASVGTVIGVLALRFHDDLFVIATFSFQVIVYSLANNLVSLAGGPLGITGIPPLHLFGHPILSPSYFLFVLAILFLAILWVARRIVYSPYGRILRAIREDEIFALAAGKNVHAYKISIFIISSMMASMAGVMYAHYVSFVDPSTFTVMESILILSAAIIGGAGRVWSPLLGSTVLIATPEALRFAGIPSSMAGNIRQILFGAILVAFMMWRPQGLIDDLSNKTKTIDKCV